MSTRLKENFPLLFILCVVFTPIGCMRPASNLAPPLKAVSSVRKPVSQSAVVLSPLYLQAKALCKQNRFQQAADSLLRLSQTPHLSPEDKTYCLQQRNLCLSHLPSSKIQLSSFSTVTSVRSNFSSDCGPRALLFLSQRAGVRTNIVALRTAGATNEKGTTMAGMAKAAQSAGWKTEGVQVSREALPETSLPAIAWVDGNHYVSLLEMSGRGAEGTALIQDPSKPESETISQEKLLQRCGGYLLLLKR